MWKITKSLSKFLQWSTCHCRVFIFAYGATGGIAAYGDLFVYILCASMNLCITCLTLLGEKMKIAVIVCETANVQKDNRNQCHWHNS